MMNDEKTPNVIASDLNAIVRRKAFICVHCDGVYADQPVSQCDCMEGTGADFIEGVIEYRKANTHNARKSGA